MISNHRKHQQTVWRDWKCRKTLKACIIDINTVKFHNGYGPLFVGLLGLVANFLVRDHRFCQSLLKTDTVWQTCGALCSSNYIYRWCMMSILPLMLFPLEGLRRLRFCTFLVSLWKDKYADLFYFAWNQVYGGLSMI